MSKAASSSLFFYQGDKLVTVKQGDQHRAIFRSAELPLAEQHVQAETETSLLATDDKGSVLNVHDDEEPHHAFTAYGHDPTQQNRRILLGFNGERFNAASTSYELGNGYRGYSPALMRFRSPDHWSPFGRGGFNDYAYCCGDPLNYSDPSGHVLKATKMTVPPKNRIVRRFDVEHRETLKTIRVEAVGNGDGAVSQLVTTVGTVTRSTEIFEVLVDPHFSRVTTHITRANLDRYLEISNTLQAARSANAVASPDVVFGSAYLNNLENQRQGLALFGQKLAKRTADPLDLSAYLKDTYRVAQGAAALRRM